MVHNDTSIPVRQRKNRLLRDAVDYEHPNFKRGRKDLLPLVERKLQVVVDSSKSPFDASEVAAAASEQSAPGTPAHAFPPMPRAATLTTGTCDTSAQNGNSSELSKDTASAKDSQRDIWKARLGPATSDERSVADAPVYDHGGISTQVFTSSESPAVESSNGTSDSSTHPNSKEDKDVSRSPIQNLVDIGNHLPLDWTSLVSLLYQTNLLSALIAERLQETLPPWRTSFPVLSPPVSPQEGDTLDDSEPAELHQSVYVPAFMPFNPLSQLQAEETFPVAYEPAWPF